MSDVVTFITVSDRSSTESALHALSVQIQDLNGAEIIRAGFDEGLVWKGTRLDAYIVSSFRNQKDSAAFAQKLASIDELSHVCCFSSKQGYRFTGYVLGLLGRLLYRPKPSVLIDEQLIAGHLREDQDVWFTPDDLGRALRVDLEQPMHIVTLNEYREYAYYKSGNHKKVTGEYAYNKSYGNSAIIPALRHGAHPVYLSTELAPLYASEGHPLNQKWNDVQVNAYVTRGGFFRLIQDDSYAKASEHRSAALKSSFIQCSTAYGMESADI